MLTDPQNQDNLNNKQTLPRDHNQLSNPILNFATEQYRLNRPFYFYSEYLRYLFANTYFTGTLEEMLYISTDERKIAGLDYLIGTLSSSCTTGLRLTTSFWTSTRTDYTKRADERR